MKMIKNYFQTKTYNKNMNKPTETTPMQPARTKLKYGRIYYYIFIIVCMVGIIYNLYPLIKFYLDKFLSLFE